MKKYIVITSIFPPSKAVETFSQLLDYNTIIVGDKKTPDEYFSDYYTFLSVKQQEDLGYKLCNDLPYNHYCRKNIGYIYAIKQGAEVIIDTDDDNMPYPDWSFPEFEGKFDFTDSKGFINIYSFFTNQNIWPRGFPLDEVRKGYDPYFMRYFHRVEPCSVGIWQGLADDDPDVDAIYRLLTGSACYFNKRNPVVLGPGTYSPFNSQNTAFRKELFPLLYMPATVTPRFTDILRGYIAQPIMWLYGYLLGVTQATVYQERNEHDLMKDFESEIPMYLQSRKVVETVSEVISSDFSIESNLFLSYEALYKKGIVKKKELSLVRAWLKDIEK